MKSANEIAASSVQTRRVDRKQITVKILRQADYESKPYWEVFVLEYRPNLNVISILMDIRTNPVTTEGKNVTPVAWDCSCLEEVCGICSMNINGVPRQACTALVDQLPEPIILEPFRKFPVIRDLVIDRSTMFEDLRRIKAWIPIDGTYDLGEGPRMDENVRSEMYKLSQCITCGCCVESCPQVNDYSKFIGPAAISQVRLFNNHPTGKMQEGVRLDALMAAGGVQACGNAQNCVRVCPKSIPLTDSIAELGRKITVRAIKKFINS